MNCGDRLAQRGTGRQVERKGDRRELTLMADEGMWRAALVSVHHGRERDLLARDRRVHIDLVQGRGVALQARQYLEHTW